MTELNLKTYHTKPAQVEAIQITEENMEAVAKWCDGKINTPKNGPKYIKVQVWRAANEKQTMGTVGDWILRRRNGFKVYTDTAFKNSYHDGEAIPMVPNHEKLAVEAVFFGLFDELKQLRRQVTYKPLERKDPIDGPVPDAHEVVFTPARGVSTVDALVPKNPSTGKPVESQLPTGIPLPGPSFGFPEGSVVMFGQNPAPRPSNPTTTEIGDEILKRDFAVRSLADIGDAAQVRAIIEPTGFEPPN